MAGLLDMVNDPNQAFLTQLGMGLLGAGGPSNRPVSFGQAFGSAMAPALQGAQNAQEWQQQEALKKLQIAEIQRKQNEAARKLLAQQTFKSTLPASEGAMFDVDPDAYFQTLREQRKPLVVGEGGAVFQGGKQVFANQKAPEIKEGYLVRDPSSHSGWRADPDLFQLHLQGKKAGASNISQGVQFPKEQFKNERDLRNDFQGLPTTKAFKEVQTAYDQISTALANPSPANDLAAATKFMKMLDPGSVVRESELGMAMAATGLSDRVINYADMIVKGTKLTPSQRNDFAAAAAELYRAAQGRFNETANEYQSMAKAYGLNPDRITKVSKEVPKSRFFEVGGKKIAAKLEPDGNYYATIGGKRMRWEE